MKKSHAQFTGSIPEQYDTFLGPLLFEFSAKDLANRITEKCDTKDGTILEIAAGTGISTEYIRESLPDDVSIVATDLNDAMLEVARQKRRELKNVTYQVADAMDLPFDDEKFDAAVCQFGIMFYPDKTKGMSEMARVVKSGGPIIFNVWDSIESNPAVKVTQDVIASFFDGNPPTFLNTPFGFNNVTEIKELMENAGLKNIESNVVSTTIEDQTALSIAEGFITGNPTIIEIEKNPDIDAGTIITATAKALEKEFGADKPKIQLQEIVFSGIKS